MDRRPTPNRGRRPPETKPSDSWAPTKLPPGLPLDVDRQPRASSADGYLKWMRNSWGPDSDARTPKGGPGRMGQSMRRLSSLSLPTSLDHTRMFREELSRVDSNPSSVSDYQLVFQKMKQEHPGASLGALHQMALARIAELKARRERRVALEEERLRRQNPAEKALGRCLGKIRRGIRDVEHLSVPDDSPQSDGSSSRHIPGMKKTGSHDSILGLIMPAWRPPGSAGVSEAGSEEKRDDNLAPKKSVSAELEGDHSFRSFSTYGSGWTRISSKSKGHEEDIDDDADVPCVVKVGGGANHDNEGAGAISSGKTLRKGANDSTTCASTSSEMDLIVGFTANRQLSSPDIVRDFDDSSNLIVGFFGRSTSNDEEDWDDSGGDGDGLIVGFVQRGNRHP